MFTRSDYMNTTGTDTERNAAHRRFYGEIAEAARVNVPQELVAHCALLLADGDVHLNQIGLPTWDGLASIYQPAITKALNDRGDFWSLAGGVCTMKEAAKRQVEALVKKE